jgi:hypothetical protein
MHFSPRSTHSSAYERALSKLGLSVYPKAFSTFARQK